MLCPNCNQTIDYINLDSQHILHCHNCGASFFEENAINRISIKSAELLADDKLTDEVFGNAKNCPKDKTKLNLIENNETMPQDVTLLRCPSCRGIFSYPDDLLRFKKAQDVKIEFFKLWNKPLPSLRTVLVLSFVAIMSFTVISRFSTFLNQMSRQSQATDLIKKIYISKSDRYLFISFKTDTQFRSEIIFTDITTGGKIMKTISNNPTNLHYLTTGDVNLDNEVFYQLILINDKGKIIKTDSKKLEIK